MLDNSKWRLGHRRPWWQWNVITLAAALFVLIWSREIFELTTSVWPLCMLIFFIWLVFPIAIPEPVRPDNADPFFENSPAAPAQKPPTASNTTTPMPND